MARHEYPAEVRLRPGQPERTCIGCRQLAPAADLLRIVARPVESNGWTVVPDPGRRLPGRGAWLHRDRKCLGQAEKRRAFGRALRVSGSLDTAALDHLIGPVTRPDPDTGIEPQPQQSSTS